MEEKKKFKFKGWMLPLFVMPFIGFILFFVWKKRKPWSAKTALKFAIIGTIIGIIMGIIFSTVLKVCFNMTMNDLFKLIYNVLF